MAALVTSLCGCVEAFIDEKEEVLAHAVAMQVVTIPSKVRMTYTNIGGETVPKLVKGWCKTAKPQLTHLFSGKREYYFMSSCKPVAPFKIRVDFKSTPPLIYVEPILLRGRN